MSGFKKVLLGCSVVFFLGAAAIAVFVGMNWDKISNTYNEVKVAFGEVENLQEELLKEYGPDTLWELKEEHGIKSLSISVINHIPPEGTGLEAEARKIATFAARLKGVPELTEVVIVYFEQSSEEKVINYSKTARYSFSIQELLSSSATALEASDTAH